MLAELAELDINKQSFEQAPEQSKFERYLKLFHGGQGDPDRLLKWWKVCTVSWASPILILCFFDHMFVTGHSRYPN
jgi:hypothetical protein